MRIKEISVEGLFGTFNHTIPLNQAERITIIHSPNGYGKTAILRLVKSMLNGNLTELGDISFQRAFIKFEDNYQYNAKREKNDIELQYLKDNIVLFPDKAQKFIETTHDTACFISIERIYHQRLFKLIREIEQTTKEYTSLTQILERTYPSRLVERKNGYELNELKQKLREIEDKQKELVSVGLLDEQNITSDSFIEKVDESNNKALSLYVEDMTKKLTIFEDLEKKVDILKEIINSRFLYKKMLINKSKGIYFVNDNGIELSFQSLSSGEQHELILFFELLFNVEENTLVLIDEPELSLHVSWQIQFLKDLIRVAQNAKFDVLLATHSPQIINDRWDLTVELKGKPVVQPNGNKMVTV